MTEAATEPLPEHVRVLVVGGGFAGIGMAVRLLEDGVRDLIVLERAEEVGGTWRDNSYPGCACDVQSTLYAFSFAPKPDWSRVYAPQAEIWAYLREVVERFGLRPYLRLGTELLSAAWDDDAQLWRVATSRGPVKADVLVTATGALCEPRYPRVAGLDSFAGPSWHSARWRHDVDLSGLRVGVVGTGASSVQLVPHVAERAAHLTVFQRTPPWVLPRGDRPVSRRRAAAYAKLPALQRLSRTGLRLQHELLLANFRSLRVSSLAARYGRRQLARTVADPRLRAALTPDYAPGCKRVLLSDDYLPALQRPDVDVVTSDVTRVVPTGVVTVDGVTHPLDALVLATGFHVTDQPVAGLVTGRAGHPLAEVWQGSPRAHLGTTVAGFPNLFLLLGPNTGLGHSSVLLMLEAQIGLVRQAVRLLDGTGSASIEPTAQAQRGWNRQVDARMRRTVWVAGGCTSWYLDETGRNSTLWPGTTYSFERALSRLDPTDYVLRPRRRTAVRTDA